MDERLAITELARWWHSASEEARYQVLRQAAETNRPPHAKLLLAIYLAEAEAGTIEEGECGS